jgi:hypothetical protein
MKLISEEVRSIDVRYIDVLQSGEIQIVTDYYPTLIKNKLLVFVQFNGIEVIGVVNDVQENETDSIIYVEINPQQAKEFSINNTSQIVIWGKIEE